MGKATDRISELPVIRLTRREFFALPEYSASLPTGTTPGKRWRRLDGAFDQRCKSPVWMIGEYDPKAPNDKDIAAMKARGEKPPKQISVYWYRPVIAVRAATKEIQHG